MTTAVLALLAMLSLPSEVTGAEPSQRPADSDRNVPTLDELASPLGEAPSVLHS